MGKRGLIESTVSSQTTSAWLPVNYRNPHSPNLGVALDISGNLTASIEFTNSDIQNGETAVVHTMMSGKSATTEGVLAASCTAIRLNVTAFTDGTATIRARQGM